ncbi:unnamed protein product [Leptosia nina]|uniref:PX domain-containing protein n=1 Tax=Leptosia nina TaxID=320188 RepID=A0AAV1K084_9NEOP
MIRSNTNAPLYLPVIPFKSKMASESSSAVLDLNDVDTTDTEVGSVTDDREGSPLIMETGYDIAIKVDGPMKQLSTLETYVTYRVRCVCARWQSPPFVRRRYNHFKLLHKRLCASQPLVAIPPLPPLHSARQQLDRYSPSFVAVRSLALDAFMERIAKHPILTHSNDLRLFVITPDEEFDKVFKSENSALNLWGLSSALYGNGEAKSNNGARVKDPEFTAAADYMKSLQQKLTTLCTLTNKLYDGSVSLSNEYTGMRRVCDAWGSQVGGRSSRACGAISAGCASAAAARSKAPLKYKAILPLLAAYANAHLEKIKTRDALHAAYCAGNNATDESHNRLEQASEALRSELADWIPKTREEIKTHLLELADRQVAIHTQSLMGWEAALKLSSDTDISELFKTVSKTAVQNLSPSKCPMTDVDSDIDSDSTDRKGSKENGRIKADLNDNSDLNDKNDTHTNETADEKTDDEMTDRSNVKDNNEISNDRDISNDIKFVDPLQNFTDVELS